MKTHTESMNQAAQLVAEILKNLANSDRLLLLCQLSQQEASVTELGKITNIQQPTLSQQLGVLRHSGLVDTRREGRKIYYFISDQKILEVMQLLFDLYCPTTSENTN